MSRPLVKNCFIFILFKYSWLYYVRVVIITDRVYKFFIFGTSGVVGVFVF